MWIQSETISQLKTDIFTLTKTNQSMELELNALRITNETVRLYPTIAMHLEMMMVIFITLKIDNKGKRCSSQ